MSKLDLNGADINRAVAESVAGEIANLGSPESRRSYEHVWRYFTQGAPAFGGALKQQHNGAIRPCERFGAQPRRRRLRESGARVKTYDRATADIFDHNRG